MLTSRTLGRTRAAPRVAVRNATRTPQRRPLQHRFQSTTTSSASGAANAAKDAASKSSPHLTSGIIGSLIGASALYLAFTMTPTGRMTSKINKAAREADKKYQAAAASLQAKAPSSTDEALGRLKEFCYGYAAWVPGGRAYVDAAFRDVEAVRAQSGDEADALVADAYRQFQDVARAGLSLDAASRAWDALADLTQKAARLAGGAAEQILDNHPQLRETVGGPMATLQSMGEQYGPEAKKMVDDTWDQVRDALKSGFSAETADKVRGIVEDKTKRLKEMGDKAWDKGMQQAKPYLEKNPKVKELVENNADMLKRGDATALFKQVRGAVESGDVGKLEEYVKKAVDKAKSSPAMQKASSMMGGGSGGGGVGGGALSGLGQFMGAGKVQQNIELLTHVINNHSAEGKKLLEETKDELTKVLEAKAKKAQEIVDEAKKEKA